MALDMTYENGLDGYNPYPRSRSSVAMEAGTYESWCVGQPSGASLQILHPHHTTLISDRLRSQAETDAEQAKSLMSCRARWVVGGHGLCDPYTASTIVAPHDR